MFGTSHFVLYREVVLSSEACIIEKGHQNVSFIERFFLCLECPYQRFYCSYHKMTTVCKNSMCMLAL